MTALGNDLVEAAVRSGLIDPATADRVRQAVRRERLDPLRALTLQGRVPAGAIHHAVAVERGIEFVHAVDLVPSPELVRRLPVALLRRRRLLPVREDAAGVLVATEDLANLDDGQLVQTLQTMLGRPARFALSDPDRLGSLIDRLAANADAGAVASSAQDAVAFVDATIRDAFVHRATDIHFEPTAEGYRVRLRVDGHLRTVREHIVQALALAVLSRLKVLSGMDIAESREPQDGSFTFDLREAGCSIDVRLATAPTRHGERATLRLLGADARDLSLEELGFSQTAREQFRELIRHPSGLILLTGPTGSGKTTTLYATLREINRPEINVMTVEDPVEYLIPGVSQVEIDDVGKITFASALRSLLRHDPDVLMIGEIRDRETAEIGLRSAATGHLVFSTLHTNTAAGAVPRLIDMGCEPFMLAATLLASVSQRLVRRLCAQCRTARAATMQERAWLEATGDDACLIHESAGCVRCYGIGCFGRIAVTELFRLNDRLREIIAARGSEADLLAASPGHVCLRRDGIQKVLAGLTTLEELRRVVVLEE